jgi:hypothetical protein
MKFVAILLVFGFLLIGCGQNRENIVPGTYNANSSFMNKMDADCRAKNYQKFNPATGLCE